MLAAGTLSHTCDYIGWTMETVLSEQLLNFELPLFSSTKGGRVSIDRAKTEMVSEISIQ